MTYKRDSHCRSMLVPILRHKAGCLLGYRSAWHAAKLSTCRGRRLRQQSARKPLCAILGQATRPRLQAFPVQAGHARVPGPQAGVLLPSVSQTQRAKKDSQLRLGTLRW